MKFLQIIEIVVKLNYLALMLSYYLHEVKILRDLVFFFHLIFIFMKLFHCFFIIYKWSCLVRVIWRWYFYWCFDDCWRILISRLLGLLPKCLDGCLGIILEIGKRVFCSLNTMHPWHYLAEADVWLYNLKIYPFWLCWLIPVNFQTCLAILTISK